MKPVITSTSTGLGAAPLTLEERQASGRMQAVAFLTVGALFLAAYLYLIPKEQRW